MSREAEIAKLRRRILLKCSGVVPGLRIPVVVLPLDQILRRLEVSVNPIVVQIVRVHEVVLGKCVVQSEISTIFEGLDVTAPIAVALVWLLRVFHLVRATG